MDGQMVLWLTTVYVFAIFTKGSREQNIGCLPELPLVGKERNLSIPDSSYTASSYYKSEYYTDDVRYQPHNAKLYGSNGWAPKDIGNPADYLQIDLGTPRVITAVATQGNGFANEWVTSYNINYTSNLKKWTSFTENDDNIKTFVGNSDRNTVVRHNLIKPITARYIRFVPGKCVGHKTMRVNVYVTDRPDHLQVTPLEKSIVVYWEIPGSYAANPIKAFWIKLGNMTQKAQSNKRSSYTWSGLKPYTEYSVSVGAKTQNGCEAWSQVQNIKTLIAVPEVKPTFLVARPVSSDTIELEWTIPNRDGINGPLRGYDVTYSEKTTNKKVVNIVANSVVARCTLQSLKKYTNYSITVAVRNTRYTGPASGERVVRTKEDAPSAPRNVRVILTAPYGLQRPRVRITWDKPANLNGIIRKYTIKLYYNNGASKKVLARIKADKTRSLNYTSIAMSGGTFSYSISASTIKEGPYTYNKTITVPEYRCPERSLVGENRLVIPKSHYNASSQCDKHYATLNAALKGLYRWVARDVNNPDDFLKIDLGTLRVITAVATQGNACNTNEWVTKYELYYKSQNLVQYDGGTEFKGNVDALRLVRHDLENPISARYIKFIPTGYHGRKAMSINVYVSFQEAPHIMVDLVSERSIKLSWTVKKCNPAHLIVGYTVKLEDKTGMYKKNFSEPEGYTGTINNLKPYTEYNVSVRTISKVGNGVWSNITTTRTTIAKPEAIPVDIKAEAKPLGAITLQWKLEKDDLIHGPFKGYRIFYNPDGGTETTRDFPCKVVTKYTTYTLESLLKYTYYKIRVAVMNENYIGEAREAPIICTSEDKPDKSPRIIHIEARSSESIFLKWEKVDPREINGNFKANRITYTPHVPGGKPNVLDVGDCTEFTLTLLLKYTYYTVTIAVMNDKFVGPSSTGWNIRTLEDAPSPPTNVTGTLIPPQDFFGLRVNITWDRPRDPNGIIRKYTIVYYYNEDTSKETVTINGTSDLQYIMNVTNRGVLSFQISATTIKEGPYQSGKVTIPSDSKGTSKRNTQVSGSATSGLVAGIVVGIILILLFLVLAFSIYKRKRIHSLRYEAGEPLPLEAVDQSSSSATLNSIFVNAPQETTPEIGGPSALYAKVNKHRASRSDSPRSVSIKPIKRPIDFPAPDINKLKKEFKGIPVEPMFDCKQGMKSGNKAKNRYKNIIAYDHSLVTLEWVYGETESFYINANYIHGYDGTPEEYIATQGPLNTTINDFWRMIWEQKVSSIVMLTNLRELGKIKCYQYWPENCDEYLDITVTNHKTEVFADFTIRTFFLSKAGSSNRRVRQFHFTAWPDKGVPDHATAVLSFRRKVLALSSNDDSSPTVVHCSAGVGRTGTYIMIDAMLRQAQEQQHVDILNYLKSIRNDRPYMVQTVEQYIFVNMAIYDALACGNTEVPVQNLPYAIQQLSIVDRRCKQTGYALEFQRLEEVTLEDTQSGNFDVGLSRKNSKKNRYPSIVAANSNRVILSTDDETEIGDYINASVIEAYKERKGDYINASFVDTYREHNAFIMTQAPLENTIADFWRMVMDYKIGTIVMLNNLREECEVYPQYWPLHQTKNYEGIKVYLFETKHLPGNILLRVFEVSNHRKQFTVKHFQHLTWENKCVPTNAESVLKLLYEVQKSQQNSGNSPIVVQCNNGVGRSGTFCAIASCLERVKQEQVLDVFQTIKSIRVNRPGAVETLTQYVFCYNIIQKYLDSFRDYANFGDI